MNYVILLGLILIAVIWQIVELQQFHVVSYNIHSDKITTAKKIAFLSDLHGKTFGDRLINTLQKEQPDFILIGGDVISKKRSVEMDYMPEFLEQISKIAPVYYCFGNHETTIDAVISKEDEEYEKRFLFYLEKISHYNIHLLRNEAVEVGNDLLLLGLELPVDYFGKEDPLDLTKEAMEELLPPVNTKRFQILLAHHPRFGDVYGLGNYDLVLSGHTHGGLIRFPVVGSIISTELTLFPKYDGGFYCLNNETPFVVSKGLGTHTFHIRVNDRAEVVMLHILP
ncbi:MAG: metallophosphoesterase [Lachnospiraceae bacterium]|nr:metallophosphoesterase [Lachnospiraceae bacterium]